MASTSDDEWLTAVASRTHRCFGDLGKIRVGIKTTADKIFIRSDWNDLPADDQPEVLRPVVTHHNAGRFSGTLVAAQPMVLYPHVTDGGKRRPIRLEDYPKTARYLEKHRAKLEGRSYVADAGRAWYEIWVPHDPDLWTLPKIVFRDISAKPEFWLDRSGAVVNGDCYWLAPSPGTSEDLMFLALAVANSSFIECF